jgi:hypothetical protein
MRVARPTEALPLSLPPTTATEPEPPSMGHGEPSDGATRAVEGPAAKHFAQLLRGLGKELDRGENLAESAIRGSAGHASLSPERLIALQAGIYRYSEAVDLVTKLVDRGTQAVRTTLQNQ